MHKVAALNYAFAEATVPMVSVVVGSAIGGATSAWAAGRWARDMVYAWPEAVIARSRPTRRPSSCTVSSRGERRRASRPPADGRSASMSRVRNPVKAAEEGPGGRRDHPARRRSYVIAPWSCSAPSAMPGYRHHSNLPL